MFQLFFSVLVVLAVPAQDYHLHSMETAGTGKPMIRSVIRCIKNGGYAEVHGSAADNDQIVQIWCYTPNPPEPVAGQLVVESHNRSE